MTYRQIVRELQLPILDVLDELLATLSEQTSSVLIAPPGAGKTTIVPLALIGAKWLGDQKVVVVVPRRLAARSAAERMAQLLDETVGETVGIRVRLASQVGPSTRIEFVTAGVFTRMVIDDPELSGIGAIVFDEFHERSLEADLGVALTCDVQSGLRDDLRLLVMSATLDGGRISSVLDGAPIVESQGRLFPIETRYIGGRRGDRIEPQVCAAVIDAIKHDEGSCLVFLPGQGEIRRVLVLLQDQLQDKGVEVLPLYGGMSLDAQRAAIRPSDQGQRKVVLATAIAETSITIEDVRIVIDAGLARVPRFDVGARLTRLETVRVSRASADQRRGRAGRTATGVCYRLWNEPETQGLRPFEAPEIQSADLTDMVLSCAAWGVTDPAMLNWIDTPPSGAIAAAHHTLADLGALDEAHRITPLGERLRKLPLPPHLGLMLLVGAAHGQAEPAADLCALLVEQGVGGQSTDLEERLSLFRRDRGRRSTQVRGLARQWARDAESLCANGKRALAEEADCYMSTAQLLMSAYSDRVAKRRGARGQYLLANGRAAQLDESDPLSASDFLVVADLQGTAARPRILAAVNLQEAELVASAADRFTEFVEVAFDLKVSAVRADRVRRLDALVLRRETHRVPRDEATAKELARGIVEHLGLMALPWSKAQRQLLQRIRFLLASQPAAGSSWPDVTEKTLLRTHATWLAPFLVGKTSLKDVTTNDLGNALDGLLNWQQRQRLEAEVPAFYVAPSGNQHPIDYTDDNAPVVSLRVQEVYGLRSHPSIAGGRLPLTLSLLSPAGRPIQVTRDLPGFWEGSWRDVRIEMKGRYPKHVWPDDPATAVPTTRAKPHGGSRA